ncbi:MAG TPA: S-layer homology domain-containing protein [Thermoanaerobaculia bacterium]|nr:S-layer homology domain-containing protein [Thermoanaerobaculia bacterium]
MRAKLVAASVAFFAGSILARGQTPVMGPEFQVNTTTSGLQYYAAVASLGSSNNFVVVWTSDGQDGSAYGVFGRRFDTTGAAQSAEFQVNVNTTGYQGIPRIGSNADGNFVVTWTEYVSGGGASYEVRARVFDASGTPQSGDIAVNTYTTGVQALSSVAVSGTGSFVVVWESGPDDGSAQVGQDGNGFGVFGQRFDASGNKAGSEFQVNQYTTSYQAVPVVAMNPAGDFIVVWDSPQDAQAGAIMARRYDASGTALGAEFQVNSTELGAQYRPDVALDPTGNAIVVWTSYAQDGDNGGIFAQRLDPSGNKLGPEFNVNSYTTDFQGHPRVAVGPHGDFTIVWNSYLQDGSGFGVYAQHYDPNGKRDTGELVVNTVTNDYQVAPVVAAQSNGQFVTAWQSYLQDGSDYGVIARVAGFPAVRPFKVDVHAPTAAPATSNLNGVLEAGETVVVETAFYNGSNAPLSLTGTGSNLRGPAGPTYTLNDAGANYGDIAAGGLNDCFDATGDCFVVTVSGARPTQHWDALLDETLSYNGFERTAALHVGGSFPDMPQNAFYPFVENLFHNGVTGGCAGGGFCPGNDVTRAQMAVFLLKSRWGSGFVPPAATGTVFLDVPASNPFARWIEELAREGVTGGCGSGNYCPDESVTRQQMAVFLLKMKNGSTYTPPTGTGIFGDVTCPSVFCDFIEELYHEGITGGCQTDPTLLYCPTLPNLRQQMAVFLVKTFNLQLYAN